MGANRRPFRFLATSRVPLRLATGIAVAGLAWQTSPKPLSADSSLSSSGEKIKSAFDGVVRSSRAVYTITFIIVDYKYYLRSLPPNSSEYRIKLSEVHLRSARRLLRLCEANKGFYVKAGQFVSSLRQVPKEYSSALSSLQDQAIPCHFKDIKEVITKNLGKDLSEVFLAFDEQPMAAASIAQVHRGVLKDNKEVAIKVQYPGLEQRMKIDITTMDILSKLVSWIFPDYRFERVVSEFERATSLELDFIQEANNSERTARNFKKNNIIKIPHVYWDLTTRHVLTMQFCSGHKVDDLDFLKDSGINPKKVAKALMEVFAEMIFVHGFLHGDPHPGNILVSPEGHHRFSLVLLDHGIYRELDERFRLDYCQLWKALILLDSQKIQHLGERFGVGKYSKYFPVIFTGRTIDSKSALGGQMSNEEKKRLKQELRSLRMEDISSFLESLPDDFLSILRTDGLLRSIISKLGAPRRVRLLAYARYAAYGLGSQSSINSGSRVTYALSQIRTNVSYIQFRILIEILALLSQIEDMRYSLVSSLRRMLHGVVYFLSGTLFFLHS
ncbi:aarF domain-containing protein kinase 1-like isoform X1 [Phoenix dactylifera]|uniref:AarF domain-containing protein kinase 1-like isoform X1 n=1 Tax=Phoenix dactylifera TaxID=42345 RepID=A0A8B9AIE3_PHODC|nr:aarF domain-containing protein kinase 1-like isoform X1 [Phoenix dactylifera]